MNENEVQETVSDAQQNVGLVVETATQEIVAKSKDVFIQIGNEIENLTKTKALNEATRLSEDIDRNAFRLGGVLNAIYKNTWFDGYETFGEFVSSRFGFQERKAKYLIEIYTNLVDKQIPWELVGCLGWTKLKTLARHLTAENAEEWVEKAKKLTVLEIEALLKGATGSESDGKVVSDIVKLSFKIKNDQAEVINAALAKARADLGTEFDTVALEGMATAYLAGGAIPPLEDQFKQMGWEEAIKRYAEAFPDVDLTVTPPKQ